MQELNALEAREFLHEFVHHVFLAARAREERRVEKEKEEALKRVKLIERQFPGAPIPPTRKPAVTTKATVPIRIGIEKIDRLLDDSNIDLIECSNGRIKIRKNGKKQETGFTLSEEEIRDITNKFVEKTRIPLIDNFLHASLGDRSIYIIISELIGSRFLIVKKD